MTKQPGEPAITDENWVPLGVAFAHVWAVEEARLGVKVGRGVALDAEAKVAARSLPSQRRLEELLRENPIAVVDSPAEERKKKILSLTEIAATQAHLRMMSLLQTGELEARGRWTGSWMLVGQPDSMEEMPLIRREFWNAGFTKDKRILSPIPDYRSGVALDNGGDAQIGFWGTLEQVEVKRSSIVEHVGSCTRPENYPPIEGGAFRYNGSKWTVSCGGVTADVPTSNGMVHLALLLSRLNDNIAWSELTDAAAKFATLRSGKQDAIDPSVYATDSVKYQHFTSSNDEESLGPGYGRHTSEEDIPGSELDALSIEENDNKQKVQDISSLLTTLEKLLHNSPKSRKLRIEHDIARLKGELEKARNAVLRRNTDEGKHRQRVFHALDDAFRQLTVLCPPFVRHLGTNRERVALEVIDGHISYRPERLPSGAMPKWDVSSETTPTKS